MTSKKPISAEAKFRRMNLCRTDIANINRLVESISGKTDYFRRADIYGLSFSSRGLVNRVATKCNKLAQTWDSTNEIKSWIKCIDYLDNGSGKRTLDSLDFYGQTNGFIRLDCPSEALLHNVPFANISTRNSFRTRIIYDEDLRCMNNRREDDDHIETPPGQNEVNFMEHIGVQQEKYSIRERSMFFPCAFIYSTKVLLLPTHSKKFPISKDPCSYGSDSYDMKTIMEYAKPFPPDKLQIAEEFRKYYADCQADEISYITVIDQHPSRLFNFRYAQDQGAHDKYINSDEFDY